MSYPDDEVSSNKQERHTWKTFPHVMVAYIDELNRRLNEVSRSLEALSEMNVEIAISRTDNVMYVSERKLRS